MRYSQAPSPGRDQDEVLHNRAEREQLVLNVAHELKSPLTGLRLQVERAQRQLARQSQSITPEAYARFVAQVDHGLMRMQRLVDDLLEVYQLKDERLALKLQTQSLAQTVEAVLSELEPQLARNAFELRRRLAKDCFGTWDASRLQQVVTNLINNAMHYGASPIEVQVRRHDKRAEVVVRDHGDGIPHDERDGIFAQFERGEAADGTPGLGLGLFICRSIVRAHGGELSVRDPEGGRGVEFVVQVPLDSRPSHAGETH